MLLAILHHLAHLFGALEVDLLQQLLQHRLRSQFGLHVAADDASSSTVVGGATNDDYGRRLFLIDDWHQHFFYC